MKKNEFTRRLPDYNYFIQKVLFEIPMARGQRLNTGFIGDETQLEGNDEMKEKLLSQCKTQIDNAIIDFLEQWENNFDETIITHKKVDSSIKWTY